MSNKSDVTDSCSGEEFSPFFWKILDNFKRKHYCVEAGKLLIFPGRYIDKVITSFLF